MKAIVIVLDGVGDRPSDQLGGETPLESAEVHSMDYLARIGSCGIIDVIKGIAPESDSAVLSLLGYDPKKYYTGRGPLEAVGIGVKMKPGMLALRCNFATSSNGIDLVDRRVARSLTSKEAGELASFINSKVRLKGASFVFSPSVDHRAVLVIKTASGLSSKITNTDPAYKIGRNGLPEALHAFEMKVCRARPLVSDAALAAELVNEFTDKCHEVLKDHPINRRRVKKGLLPANMILSRDAGNKVPDLGNISEKYNVKFAILADMPLEIGIGRVCRMGVVRLPLPTFRKEDHIIRVSKALSAIKRFDAIYIHIKGPDLFGHEGDFIGKRNCISDIDSCFLSPLIKKLNMKRTVVAITADHCTPCSMKGHSSDPVPFLIAGGSMGEDGVNAFSERKCAMGALGRIKGTDFLELVVKNCRKG
ncbi:2,3-bisphosphoglycerate-independent phosphoglycerate mutase [Candidatus Woesearchaeota archaeon]|nr:2,3-bisphosphoglycerate-independent phosphoglycerate mutase [Candidatus Woesearchaeota archaeon]